MDVTFNKIVSQLTVTLLSASPSIAIAIFWTMTIPTHCLVRYGSFVNSPSLDKRLRSAQKGRRRIRGKSSRGKLEHFEGRHGHRHNQIAVESIDKCALKAIYE